MTRNNEDAGGSRGNEDASRRLPLMRRHICILHWPVFVLLAKILGERAGLLQIRRNKRYRSLDVRQRFTALL